VLAQFVAARRCAAVLPHDRVGDGLERVAIPDQRGLALVRDADRSAVAGADSGAVERGTRGDQGCLPDLAWIMLDPTGSGEVLLELAITAPCDVSVVGDDERGDPGGACVDR